MKIIKNTASVISVFSKAAVKTASYLGGVRVSRDDLIEYSFAELIEKNMAKPLGRHCIKEGKMSGFWAGNGIELNVKCRKDCILQIDTHTNDTLFLAVFFDGQVQKRGEKITKENHLFTCLVPKGTKTVRVIRDIQVSTDTQNFFYFNTLKFNGDILQRPDDKRLYIEVIGDSIACGDGANGTYTAGKAWTNPDDHSFIKGFAHKLSEKLNADLSAICRGGIGMYSSSYWSQEATANKKITVPELYDCLNGYFEIKNNPEKYGFERKPDLIIFEISGNDSAENEEEWKRLVVEFITHVREVNGEDIPIVWSGRNEAHFETIKSIIADKTFGDKFYGCYYKYGGSGAAALATQSAGHPSDAEQTEIAENLYKFIKENELINTNDSTEFSVTVTEKGKKSALKKAGIIGGAAAGAAALGVAALLLKKRRK